MKLHEILRRATERLSSVSPTARLDAEVLMAHALGLDRAGLLAATNRELDDDARQHIESLLSRRVRGEPVAYILGRREFWSLPLTITPDVLIPRPETELLVERALVRISANASIADLGTGSGAIALALAHERPGAKIIATDASAEALTVARANALALNLSMVDFRHGEWLTPLAVETANAPSLARGPRLDPIGETFDVIVSNPPYIRNDDPHLLEGDVRFEPRAALVSGADGLDAIRVIVRDARSYLKPGGWLLLEHGYDQAATIEALLKQSGYREIRNYRDLAGQARVSEARRP